MAMKQKINPLTGNFDMVSDGDSGTIKQKFNPLTGNFDMVGEGEVKIKLNPLTSNFDMVSNGEPGPTPPSPWQPDPSRTIFYYDFEQNLNDSSGNGNNIISSSNVTFAQVGGQYVALSGTTPSIATDPSYSASIGTGDFAISFWIYPVDSGTNTPMLFGIFSEDRPDYAGPTIFMDTDKTMIVRMTASNTQQTSEALAMNTWQHIVMTRNSGIVKFYLDNTEILSWSDNTSFVQSNMSAYIFSRGGAMQRFYEGAMGDKFILENVGWTDQDVSDYYNQTKGDYASSTVQIDLISTDTSQGTIIDENGNGNGHWEIAVDEGSSITYDGYDGITLYEGGVQKSYYSERMPGYDFLMIDPQPSTASEDTSIFYQRQYAYNLEGFSQDGSWRGAFVNVSQRDWGFNSYDHITIHEGYAENWQFILYGASTDPVSINVSIFNNGQTLTVNPIYDPDKGAFVFDTGTVGIDDIIIIHILSGFSDVEFDVLLETPDHDIYENDTWTIHALT